MSAWYMTERAQDKVHTQETLNNGGSLKERIDGAGMRKFSIPEYGVSVDYPEFFEADTAEEATGRFYYVDKRGRRVVSLIVYVEPNVEGWTIKEAVNNLCDSLSVCQEQGENYYILEGSIDNRRTAKYVEKCFLKDRHWINQTLFYDVSQKEAIGRLLGIVKEWRIE